MQNQFSLFFTGFSPSLYRISTCYTLLRVLAGAGLFYYSDLLACYTLSSYLWSSADIYSSLFGFHNQVENPWWMLVYSFSIRLLKHPPTCDMPSADNRVFQNSSSNTLLQETYIDRGGDDDDDYCYYYYWFCFNYQSFTLIWFLLFIVTGDFKKDQGPFLCQSCPPGWYFTSEGAIECIQCPKNFYCPVSSLTLALSRLLFV